MIQGKPNRRSLRLRGYDYSEPGAYFITVCTQRRECLFGEIVDGKMWLNEYGQIVHDEWFRAASIRPYVHLFEDEWIIMPNHVHGIIWISEGIVKATRQVGATRRVAPTNGRPCGPQPGSIGAIVGQFKSITTKRINHHRGALGAALWQRNYYEHTIRDETALHCIRQYILENPLKWHLDWENPNRVGKDEIWSEIVRGIR